MRKTILLALVTVLLFGSCIFSVSAATENEASLSDLLKTTNREIIDNFLDPELFDESMEAVVLEDQPLLLVYHVPFYLDGKETSEKTIQYLSQEFFPKIIVLNEEPIAISRYHQSWSKIGAYSYEIEPFVQDIINGRTTQDFLGQSCHISNVICLDGANDWGGVTVIFQTDKGDFIRYYDDHSQEAVSIEYSYDAFYSLSEAYLKYKKSIAYDEFGIPQNGPGPSFSDFLEDPEQYTSQKHYPGIVPICILAVIIASAVIFIIRKIAEKRNSANSDE